MAVHNVVGLTPTELNVHVQAEDGPTVTGNNVLRLDPNKYLN